MESACYTSICVLLTRWHIPDKRISYSLAIISLAIGELISLWMDNDLSPVRISAATIGLTVIIILDGQRYRSEKQNDRKLKILQKESERDDLTGLLNYRPLSQEINRLSQDRNIYNIVIGALDIDHFKHINDTYGHFVGNEVLNYFSTIFRTRIHTAFPEHGYVYRFGGEEFSIVVSNHSVEEVYQLLQKIEEAFNNDPIITKEGIKITISFSCSVTNRLKDEPLEATLKRADKMLYSVKKRGRGWIISDQNKSGSEAFKK